MPAELANVMLPLLLFVMAVINELGPPVFKDEPVNVSAPLLTRKPGVEPELMVIPLLKLIVLPDPMVSVVVL